MAYEMRISDWSSGLCSSYLYLDCADGADFVFGIDRFDAAAKAADIFVLSGVSSFPALTGAVLREMARTMDIRSVEGGIAPSPFAGIGLNVMRAVVGYAGARVKLRRAGTDSHGIGLADSMRFPVAIGRASCGERVCKYVKIPVGGVYL